MLKNYYAIIMAGGGGTRLWPLSRKKHPKQMLSLFDDRSLFQTSVERLEGVFPLENIYVITVQEQAEELRAQCPGIPEENFLIEPMPKGTASVVGLGAIALQKRDPDAVMAVLTADHYIANEPLYRKLLNTAYQVSQDGYLVTLGIEPAYPATGFGYIQQGEPIGQYDGINVFRVERFKEKPDDEHARQMLEEGGHSWNSGMFMWRVDKILDEFQRQMPDLYQSLQRIGDEWGQDSQQTVIDQEWTKLISETIDYGIMENAHQVAVIPAAGLGWSDVGSWDSLFDLLEGDESGNIIMGGKHIGLDTSETLVYVQQKHRLIVTIGVDDLVLVDTGDVLLVCHKEQAQKVRQVVQKLKHDGEGYL
jgi:mannose-1-phosphate guanylyltransferase